MNYVQVITKQDARNGMAQGIKIVADAVRSTLGPGGRNVIIKSARGAPVITKDGVTVARSITLKDHLHETGAKLVKDVASKTASMAGDGTTTATVLAEAIFLGGLQHVANGANAIAIQRGINIGCAAVVAELTAMAIPVEDQETTHRVALVSSNWDHEIASKITTAIEHVGMKGVVTIESSDNPETTVDLRDGFRFDTGWMHSNFSVIDGTPRSEVIYGQALVLVIERKLNTLKEIVPILDKLVSFQRPIVLIAESIEGEALAGLVLNHLKQAAEIMAISAPGFGPSRVAWMQDIAAMCGCVAVSDNFGIPFKDLQTNLTKITGQASIVVTENHTTLISAPGNELIQGHLADLEAKQETTDSEYHKSVFAERLACLTGKVATILVGGSSAMVVHEAKDRYDDAHHAVLAALQAGIVPGGGAALVHAARKVMANTPPLCNADELLGFKLLLKAVEEPIKQLAVNAGCDPHEVLLEVKSAHSPNLGYNLNTHLISDLLVDGIIDPAKVTISALTNASSIAGILLTTEAAVVPDES